MAVDVNGSISGMAAVMFGNNLACALGDFSENPGKISTFASLVLGGQLCFVGMRSNQLIHRGQI